MECGVRTSQNPFPSQEPPQNRFPFCRPTLGLQLPSCTTLLPPRAGAASPSPAAAMATAGAPPVVRMRISAELRREGGARPLRGADWPRRAGSAHLQQVRGADWFIRASHAPPGTAPPAVGARPPPRTDAVPSRSAAAAAAMADSAAQFSLVSSTSSTSVTSSASSSTRPQLGGCTGGSSMSCAGKGRAGPVGPEGDEASAGA